MLFFATLVSNIRARLTPTPFADIESFTRHFQRAIRNFVLVRRFVLWFLFTRAARQTQDQKDSFFVGALNVIRIGQQQLWKQRIIASEIVT